MIDSHHHLWYFSPEEYDWIPAGTPLAQDQLLPELEAATTEAGITGTVAVQARQVIDESDMLLTLADQGPPIRGVVGWVPLVSDEVSKDLERLVQLPKFRGVRHILQEEPDEYFLHDDFHRGLSLLPSLNLRYDLLLFQRQLPLAIQLVDRQPELGIIVDHIAKPEAQNGQIEPDWKSGMRELAKRDNILGVKFSGVITEFPEGPVDSNTVAAYFNETLEIFGADRVMFGSDWPVTLLHLNSYKDWADTFRSLISDLTPEEQQKLSADNCEHAYQLPPE